MTNDNLQQVLFQHIRSILPPHVSLVDAVADQLSISIDSAYRRIRGEKQISLEEVQKLAVHFKISLDQFLHLPGDSFIFSGNLVNSRNFNFEKWFTNVLQQMNHINSYTEKHTYHLTKDIPFYAAFHIPELGAFKSFFWRRSILHYDDMKGAKFSLSDIDRMHIEMGKKIVASYNQFPTTEIWNLESINSTIRQIEFYRDAHVFSRPEDLNLLYEKLEVLINHFEMQAELGLKFPIGGKPAPGAGSYTMLVNEVALGDNTFHAVLDGRATSFLNHSVINYIHTQDERFTAYIQDMLENLIRKSTRISMTNEKDRVRFFNGLRERIRSSKGS